MQLDTNTNRILQQPTTTTDPAPHTRTHRPPDWTLEQNNDTPLHIAAAMGRRKLTKILMQNGAELVIKNKVSCWAARPAT
jgi:hypothetical protein